MEIERIRLEKEAAKTERIRLLKQALEAELEEESEQIP